ncbi:MAG: LON peptidase substrate-binding domain-containing protein [Myxococcaceae bacterium]|nr:LON peptidase substrate-binding domain-containing protein [Myxococcaceae bacterium]
MEAGLEERVRGAAAALKVFPLPSAVLFPGTAIPLHIFEPRYRDMVADALRGDRVIALGDLLPGWERDYAGRPPLAQIGCAGVITWYEELPGGRYNLVLEGVARFRLIEELPPEHRYREIRAELLWDGDDSGPLDELVRQAVLEVAGRLPEEAGDSLVQQAAKARGGALADVVAASLVPELERRKELLAELDPRARLQAVLDDVGELMARLSAASPRGPLN